MSIGIIRNLGSGGNAKTKEPYVIYRSGGNFTRTVEKEAKALIFTYASYGFTPATVKHNGANVSATQQLYDSSSRDIRFTRFDVKPNDVISVSGYCCYMEVVGLQNEFYTYTSCPVNATKDGDISITDTSTVDGYAIGLAVSISSVNESVSRASYSPYMNKNSELVSDYVNSEPDSYYAHARMSFTRIKPNDVLYERAWRNGTYWSGAICGIAYFSKNV